MSIIPMRDLKNTVEVERRCAEENGPAFTSKARILFTDSPKHFFKSPRAFFKNHKSLCPPRIIMRSLRLNRAVDAAESCGRCG